MKHLFYTCLIALSQLCYSQYDSLSRFTYDPEALDQYIGQGIQWLPLYDQDTATYIITAITSGEHDASQVTFQLSGGVTKTVKPVELGVYKTFILTGYMDKLRSTYLNQKVGFVKKPVRGMKDLVSGQQIEVQPNSKWTCYAVDLAEDIYYQPCVYLMNVEGQKVRLTAEYWEGEKALFHIGLAQE
jgi:hypothetical protein